MNSNQGDVPNKIALSEIAKWTRHIKNSAAKNEFKELQLIGERAMHSTSVNPGMEINKVIKLKGVDE